MEKTERQLQLEAEYDRDIFELVSERYEDDGLSQRELANELDIPRSTLVYWLREAGVEMRRRTLTDVQRITIFALLPYLPNHRIAERVGCGKVTVARYRRELRDVESATDDVLPVELDIELTDRDRDLLTPETAAQWVADTTDDGDDATADT